VLDAAAYVPTNRLDLSIWHPDFVAISFYKMFGYPTGVGALLARRSSLERLRRPWFSGGTVVAANVQGEMVVPLTGHALFEDRTVNYLGIPAVQHRLEHIERIRIDTISRRVRALGTWLLDALQRLRHSDGSPMVCIYGPRTWDRRGATIAFNFLHPDGRVIDERFVDMIAAAHRISLRTGCFCNSGAAEIAFSLARDTLIDAKLAEGMILDDYIELIGMPTGGAVRVSLGLASNFADVYRFIEFAAEFHDVTEVPEDLPPGLAASAPSRDSGCQSSLGTSHLAQHRHQVTIDHVEEYVRTGGLTVKEAVERVSRQHQQQRALPRRRGHPEDEGENAGFRASRRRRGRTDRGRYSQCPLVAFDSLGDSGDLVGGGSVQGGGRRPRARPAPVVGALRSGPSSSGDDRCAAPLRAG
jgi:Aminotransferase class-V